MKFLIAVFVIIASTRAAPVENFDAVGFCTTALAAKSRGVAHMFSLATNCEKYVMCYSPLENIVMGWLLDCPPGTHFDQSASVCRLITDDTPCINEAAILENMCQDMDGNTYYYSDSSQYDKKDMAGRRTTQTCSDSLAFFNLDSCVCYNEGLEADECVLASNPLIKYKMAADGSSYRMINRRTAESNTQACPSSAPRFDVTECGCVDFVAAEEQAECNHYDMESDALYMEIHEATVEGGKISLVGSDNSFLQLPFYAGNDLGDKLTIAMEFQHTATSSVPISLIKNNALDVAITSDNINVFLTTTVEQCQILASFPPTMDVFPVQRSFVLKYDSVALTLKVNGVELDSVACTGGVMISPEPITVGLGFQGYIDNLIICKGLKDIQ